MREAARRQILLDMGIVPWRLRARQSPGGAVDAAPTEPTARALERQPPRPNVPPPAPVRAWSALSLVAPGVLLLADGSSSRRDQRLAADVLAAVSGDWRAQPVERRFEWPPAPMVGASAEDGRRAFTAFVDKDVTDHGVTLLLCVESLAWALPADAFGCRQQVIPPLAALGGDAEAKRTLWRALEAASS